MHEPLPVAPTRFLATMTVIGFLVPNAMVVAFVVRHGADPGAYFGAWVGTLPATQLTVDLAICAIAFLGWAMVDSREAGCRRAWWWACVATFAVGLCFGIPLYLWRREVARGLPAST